jgi:hypothetical protein
MKSGISLPSVLIAASALASATACGGPQRGSLSPKEDARERLVGAWRLASLEEPAADGKLHTVDCTGLLVFTRDGHIAVQVMYRNHGAEPGGSAYAQGGYEASFGKYQLDDGGRTFTYRVEGSLVRTLIARALPRAFELTNGRLIVRSSNPDEHWRVIWER